VGGEWVSVGIRYKKKKRIGRLPGAGGGFSAAVIFSVSHAHTQRIRWQLEVT
jgi:hypothetical protein